MCQKHIWNTGRPVLLVQDWMPVRILHSEGQGFAGEVQSQRKQEWVPTCSRRMKDRREAITTIHHLALPLPESSPLTHLLSPQLSPSLSLIRAIKHLPVSRYLNSNNYIERGGRALRMVRLSSAELEAAQVHAASTFHDAFLNDFKFWLCHIANVIKCESFPGHTWPDEVPVSGPTFLWLICSSPPINWHCYEPGKTQVCVGRRWNCKLAGNHYLLIIFHLKFPFNILTY